MSSMSSLRVVLRIASASASLRGSSSDQPTPAGFFRLRAELGDQERRDVR